MTCPRTILRRDHFEQTPSWLYEIDERDPFPFRSFFNSRVVYYPGCNTDGHPLEVFNGAHAAHCFVFCEYPDSDIHGRPLRRVMRRQLGDPTCGGYPRGYRTVFVRELDLRELRPNGWRPHITQHPGGHFQRPLDPGYAFWAILERLPGYGDEHGGHRIAIVFVAGEGIATFDALFCQGDAEAPFGVLLQDHGFGGNWTRWGRGGYLERLAVDYAPPLFLLIAEHTLPWTYFRYSRVTDEPACGGMYDTPRHLYALPAHYAYRRHRVEGELERARRRPGSLYARRSRRAHREDEERFREDEERLPLVPFAGAYPWRLRYPALAR